MKCPQCGDEESPPQSKFCEACGHEFGAALAAPAPNTAPAADQEQGQVAPNTVRTRLIGTGDENVQAPPCANCQAAPGTIDSEGFCTKCGFQRRAPARDHKEMVLTPGFAGVTDRGIKHHRNEDYCALAAHSDIRILVVCDGVSTSQNPDVASERASDTACNSLLASVQASADWRQSTQEAMVRAQQAVLAVPYIRGAELAPPEATIVTAILQGRQVTLGWIGDSRAYFIGESGSRALSRDHSWVNEVVDSRQMSMEQALKDKKAHSITRCLGSGLPLDLADQPTILQLELPGPGMLLLCSDGLWNYADGAEKIKALLSGSLGADALSRARLLTKFAIEQGGKDNITVVIALVG